MNRIDEALGKGGRKSSMTNKSSVHDQDRDGPRNYHPPESPVHRFYENGQELPQGAGQLPHAQPSMMQAQDIA